MRVTGGKLDRSAKCVLVATLAAAPLAAQQPALRFDARLVPSSAVLAGTLAAGLAPVLFAAHLPHATCAPCDPAGLPGIDRGTVGTLRTGAGAASTVTLLGTGALSGLLLITEAHGDAGVAREDLTVLAQAVASTTLLTNWVKVAFHRPRPYRYVASAAGSGAAAESGLSFPSGHTSSAFAAAFAYWSIEARRGRAHERTLGIAALVAGATATGALRVVAREHFPTDVMAGAVLGAAVGWVVPRLYPVRPRPPM